MQKTKKYLGKVIEFSNESGWGKVEVNNKVYSFHGTSFWSGAPKRWPSKDEEITVILSDEDYDSGRIVTLRPKERY